MLMASLRIARGMGSKTSEDKVKANSTATGIPAKVVGPEGVGNARLGLWLGERLLCKCSSSQLGFKLILIDFFFLSFIHFHV